MLQRKKTVQAMQLQYCTLGGTFIPSYKMNLIDYLLHKQHLNIRYSEVIQIQ